MVKDLEGKGMEEQRALGSSASSWWEVLISALVTRERT